MMSRTLSEHGLQFVGGDELAPVVRAGCNDPQDAFGEDNTESVGQRRSAECREEDGSTRLKIITTVSFLSTEDCGRT